MAAVIEVKDLHKNYGDTVAVAMFGAHGHRVHLCRLVPENSSKT